MEGGGSALCYIQPTPQLEFPCCLFMAARPEDTKDDVSCIESRCSEAEPTPGEDSGCSACACATVC